jgi:ribulose-5-phosphate 4-epimerase/fuculose-1-phosphate aldolase
MSSNEQLEGSDVKLLELPGAKKFESAEDEREHRKNMLAVALRIFARAGYDEGLAGHVTVRDPELDDHFWVNPHGLHFSRVKTSDLVLVDSTGKVVIGSWGVNKVAFQVHSAIHRARPDVIAAAHTHTIYGRAFSSMGSALLPIVQESCAFYDDHVLYSDWDGLILEEEQSSRIAGALGSKRAAILQHHGLITVGGSVEEAAWWFITLDRCCQMQLVAQAAGTPLTLSPEQATTAHKQFGNPDVARFSFEILSDMVMSEEPDVLG